MLEVVIELRDANDERSQKSLAVDTFLKQKDLDVSPWRGVAKTVADGDPRSADYVFSEWTHTRLAYEYLQKMKEIFDAEED